MNRISIIVALGALACASSSGPDPAFGDGGVDATAADARTSDSGEQPDIITPQDTGSFIDIPVDPPVVECETRGGTRYLDPTGSDDAAGTADAPWRTLEHAFLAAVPGDTVILRPGTYAESESPQWLGVRNSGTADAPITFRGTRGTLGQQLSIIDRNGAANGIWLSEVGHIVFEDIGIVNVLETGIRITQSDFISIRRCTIASVRSGIASPEATAVGIRIDQSVGTIVEENTVDIVGPSSGLFDDDASGAVVSTDWSQGRLQGNDLSASYHGYLAAEASDGGGVEVVGNTIRGVRVGIAYRNGGPCIPHLNQRIVDNDIEAGTGIVLGAADGCEFNRGFAIESNTFGNANEAAVHVVGAQVASLRENLFEFLDEHGGFSLLVEASPPAELRSDDNCFYRSSLFGWNCPDFDCEVDFAGWQERSGQDAMSQSGDEDGAMALCPSAGAERTAVGAGRTCPPL